MYPITISVRYIYAGRRSSRHPGDDRFRSPAAYPGRVRSQRQMVDYALQRRALLADVHSGRVGVAQVCDASPYLLRAARFHGEPSDVTCPVCRKERLTLVSWVFGESI